MRERLPPRAMSRRQAVWLLGLMTGLLVLLWFGGDITREALRYERVAVLRGEYWRLVTGHLVHASALHLLLNLAGVALVAALFPRGYSLTQWLVIAAASIVAMAIGFVWLEPHLEWYVGLSGVLHGLLAGGAVAWWRYEPRWLAAALTLIFVGKLAWEQLHGALPLSGDLTVVVDAHLYGAIGGGLGGIGVWLGRYNRAPF